MASKTVAFFGASTGVGLSALKHSLAAGRQCTALCRNSSKLTAIFTAGTTPNLEVMQGNVYDAEAVSRCLRTKEGKLVDEIVFTIGARFVLSKMGLDDPDVCKKGMSILLEALAELRREGITGQPYIVACSTTGMSRFARDVPLAMVPFYHVVLKVPHADKRVMEDTLAASGEDFTVVRASLLVDGETHKAIRAGIEDPKTGLESKAIGYTISREDAGKWIAQNLVLERDGKYLKKTATITY
jgi:hypothetical protein